MKYIDNNFPNLTRELHLRFYLGEPYENGTAFFILIFIPGYICVLCFRAVRILPNRNPPKTERRN